MSMSASHASLSPQSFDFFTIADADVGVEIIAAVVKAMAIAASNFNCKRSWSILLNFYNSMAEWRESKNRIIDGLYQCRWLQFIWHNFYDLALAMTLVFTLDLPLALDLALACPGLVGILAWWGKANLKLFQRLLRASICKILNPHLECYEHMTTA